MMGFVDIICGKFAQWFILWNQLSIEKIRKEKKMRWGKDLIKFFKSIGRIHSKPKHSALIINELSLLTTKLKRNIYKK